MRVDFFFKPEARRDLRPPRIRDIIRRNRCLECGHFVGREYPVPFLRLCRDCIQEVAA